MKKVRYEYSEKRLRRQLDEARFASMISCESPMCRSDRERCSLFLSPRVSRWRLPAALRAMILVATIQPRQADLPQAAVRRMRVLAAPRRVVLPVRAAEAPRIPWAKAVREDPALRERPAVPEGPAVKAALAVPVDPAALAAKVDPAAPFRPSWRIAATFRHRELGKTSRPPRSKILQTWKRGQS